MFIESALNAMCYDLQGEFIQYMDYKALHSIYKTIKSPNMKKNIIKSIIYRIRDYNDAPCGNYTGFGLMLEKKPDEWQKSDFVHIIRLIRNYFNQLGAKYYKDMVIEALNTSKTYDRYDIYDNDTNDVNIVICIMKLVVKLKKRLKKRFYREVVEGVLK